MIDHLHIKNFLAFPELEVPELKLINLVAGRNTAGKTSLLQAITILYDNNKLAAVLKILNERKIDFGHLINKYSDESNPVNSVSRINGYFIGLKSQEEYEVTYVDDQMVFTYEPKPFSNRQAKLIASESSYSSIVAGLAKIALTRKELEVIEIVNNALTIEITRISIVTDEIKVLLAGDELPVRIESLGDGVKRVLLYALSLVNAKDGLLLIDEIETHLHHSVIRKLWKIIFEYAIKWNIQVVATTHSQDAIKELFYEAAANESYQDISQVLRLQIGRSGKHEVILYPYEDLQFMMQTTLEIRGN